VLAVLEQSPDWPLRPIGMIAVRWGDRPLRVVSGLSVEAIGESICVRRCAPGIVGRWVGPEGSSAGLGVGALLDDSVCSVGELSAVPGAGSETSGGQSGVGRAGGKTGSSAHPALRARERGGTRELMLQ